MTAKTLVPENVAFPGIRYETTAYGAPSAALDDATVAEVEGAVKQMMARRRR